MDTLTRIAPPGWGQMDRIQPVATAAATGTIAAMLLGWLSWVNRAWSLPVALLVILGLFVVLALVLGARAAALALLVLTCGLNSFEFNVKGTYFRSEQIAAILAISIVLWSQQRTRPWWRVRMEEAVLLAWFALNAVSSGLFAPQPGRSYKVLALVILSAAAAFVPRRLALDDSQFNRVVQVQLVTCAGAATYAILAFLLHALIASDVGMTLNPVSHHLVASGSLWEPNVLGDFCAAGAILWALLGWRAFGWPLSALGLGVCLAGTVVSVTRAVWLALTLVAILVAISHLRQQIHPATALVGAATFGVAFLLVGVAEASGRYSAASGPNQATSALTRPGLVAATPPPAATSGTSTVQGAQTTGGGPATATTPAPVSRAAHTGLLDMVRDLRDLTGRLDQGSEVMRDLQTHLVFGSGTATFGERYQYQGQQLWIASLGLRVLNDTGLAGVAVFVIFVLLVGRIAWLNRKDETAAALGLVGLLLLLTNLSTETLELMFGWLFVGLLLARADAVQGWHSRRRGEPWFRLRSVNR